MKSPSVLGARLRKLREAKGLSALAVSRSAGLGPNYLRQLERAGKQPNPAKLAAICKALRLEEPTVMELRRLAGIDADPASTPESREARAHAWPLLTYVLVNHVLLPRLTLVDILARLQRRSSPAADYLSAAAASLTGKHFSQLRLLDAAPPRALLTLIEKTFSYLTAAYLRCHPRVPRFEVGRVAAADLLVDLASPAGSEHEAFVRALRTVFSEVFAARLFPLIYHQACQVWPFEKLSMPYALHGPVCQRAIYNAGRTLPSVADFDQVLIGCGGRLPRGQPSRPRCALSGVAEDSLREPAPDPPAPPGNPDYIFDHWDRCEFLDRFPLLKLDLAGSLRLALSIELPSLQAERARLEAFGGGSIPADIIAAKLHCKDEPLQESVDRGPESFIARLIGEKFRVAVEGLILGAAWTKIASAGQTLGIDPEFVRLADSLAMHAPGAEPPAAPP